MIKRTVAVDVVFRGITWEDYPGSDRIEKRMNFFLFRRGSHQYCKRLGELEGDALREKLQELSRPNRERGSLACKKTT